MGSPAFELVTAGHRRASAPGAAIGTGKTNLAIALGVEGCAAATTGRLHACRDLVRRLTEARTRASSADASVA